MSWMIYNHNSSTDTDSLTVL